ncbi:MAG: hypothetical protein IT350_12940, partial [Deltaproteobacteria bacterium]|nr:hypothetical protein [Deltaproteobacteria bacterium]
MSVRACAFWILFVAIVAGTFAGCPAEDDSGGSAQIEDDGDDDANPADDDTVDDDAPDDDAMPSFDQERFDRLLDQAGGLEFFDMAPV